VRYAQLRVAEKSNRRRRASHRPDCIVIGSRSSFGCACFARAWFRRQERSCSVRSSRVVAASATFLRCVRVGVRFFFRRHIVGLSGSVSGAVHVKFRSRCRGFGSEPSGRASRCPCRVSAHSTPASPAYPSTRIRHDRRDAEFARVGVHTCGVVVATWFAASPSRATPPRLDQRAKPRGVRIAPT